MHTWHDKNIQSVLSRAYIIAIQYILYWKEWKTNLSHLNVCVYGYLLHHVILFFSLLNRCDISCTYMIQFRGLHHTFTHMRSHHMLSILTLLFTLSHTLLILTFVIQSNIKRSCINITWDPMEEL